VTLFSSRRRGARKRGNLENEMCRCGKVVFEKIAEKGKVSDSESNLRGVGSRLETLPRGGPASLVLRAGGTRGGFLSYLPNLTVDLPLLTQ